jgi:hypothetical protein
MNVGFSAAPAHAGLINYSCGPNITSYTLADTYIIDVVDIAGYGWAYHREDDVVGSYREVHYTSGGGLKPGDVVALDWSDDGGANYHSCHATVPSGYTTAHTKGVNQPGGRWFRSCVYTTFWECGSWHTY